MFSGGLPSLFSDESSRPASTRQNYLVTINIKEDFIYEGQLLANSPKVDVEKLTIMRQNSREFFNRGFYRKLKEPNPIDINNPSKILLGINSLGRLGNNMCQYAHLYIFGLRDTVQVWYINVNNPAA